MWLQFPYFGKYCNVVVTDACNIIARPWYFCLIVNNFYSVETISDSPVIQQQAQTCHITRDKNCFGLPYQVRI